MDGVKEVFVDYEKKFGTFEFDETMVTKEQIIASIKELGYTAS